MTQEGDIKKDNRNLIIGAVVVIVILVGLVIVLALALRGGNDQAAAVPTQTAPVDATATALPADTETPVSEDTVEPTQKPTAEPTKEPTAEPEATATLEPTQAPPEGLPPEPQDISFTASDGQELEGRYYPGATSQSPVIILMHWAPGNMDDWNEIAFWLQNRGLSGSSSNVGQQTWLDPSWFPTLPEGNSYAVFTFNFRNGDRSLQLFDAQAAFNAVRDLDGVDQNRIASFGASIGADGAADGCAWNNETFGGGCLGALSLSPGSYLTAPYDDVVIQLGENDPPKPVWCLYAVDDARSMETCQSISGDHYRMIEWTGGNWHGMELIDPGRDPNALQLILDWLALLGL